MMQHGPTLFRTEPASFWLCLGFPSDKDVEGAVVFCGFVADEILYMDDG